MLAVLALVGCVMTILMLATQTKASRLQGEIATLNGQLAATRARLAALQVIAARADARGAVAGRDARRLSGSVAGLARTVHGLQTAATLTQGQATALRACLPQLQQELAGLTLDTRSARGRVTGVGLSDAAGLSPACAAVLSGG